MPTEQCVFLILYIYSIYGILYNVMYITKYGCVFLLLGSLPLAHNAFTSLLTVLRYIRCIRYIINPRRACAARVTVVVLCVCLFVCLSETILALQATRRLMSDTNSFSATRARKLMWRFR